MHQKVFDRRYLYWADRLGYLVWGEYGSWGFDISSHEALEHFLLALDGGCGAGLQFSGPHRLVSVK